MIVLFRIPAVGTVGFDQQLLDRVQGIEDGHLEHHLSVPGQLSVPIRLTSCHPMLPEEARLLRAASLMSWRMRARAAEGDLAE
jgi:hypothetical protein